MSADVTSLLWINTAVAALLGSSSLLALKVLPIPMRYRWWYLIGAALLWGGATGAITFVTDPPLEVELRRAVNGAALLYVAFLLMAWARRTAVTRPRRDNDQAIKA